jgi:hypothetical protein
MDQDPDPDKSFRIQTTRMNSKITEKTLTQTIECLHLHFKSEPGARIPHIQDPRSADIRPDVISNEHKSKN